MCQGAKEKPPWPQRANPGGLPPHCSTPGFQQTPVPRGRAARLNSTPPASSALPSRFPTVWTAQSLEASNSAACNPFCSHWWAAQWSSVRMVWNPGDPQAILSPVSHTPLFTQVTQQPWGRRAQGHLGLVGREEVQKDPQLGALPSSAPPTWAPKQMELASSTGMHPPSGSSFFP